MKILIITFLIILVITGLFEIYSPSLDKTSEGDYLLYYNDIKNKNKRKYIKLW